MRLFWAIRTFVANYIIPGWGFWIVGERKLAVCTAIAISALVLFFCWTRLILNPNAFIAFLALFAILLLGSCLWSAILEFRRDDESAPPRNWKGAFVFAVVVAIVVVPLRYYRADVLGYESYEIPASSMSPTLVRGDFILADTWIYSDETIAFGDLAVFRVPQQDGTVYVKRVIGMPGDTLVFLDDGMVRNGIRLSEPYAVYEGRARPPGSAFGEITVPDGHYFVLGDNRNNSKDSRYIGAVPETAFVGKVAHIWFSSDAQEGIRKERFPLRVE